MTDRLRKKLFFAVVIVNYIFVTIYEFLTPYMTDDIIYGDVVAGAGSFFDLFAQEYEHYMHHGGRSIAHFILRVFLYTGNKGVFNVVAGIAFTALSLLIYSNIDRKREFDLRVYIGILMLMWLFEPAISNTVFWETGACNYLFTALIMFGYITFFRKALSRDRQDSASLMALMFIFGVAAGWCNENSSGGVIFIVVVLMIRIWLESGKRFSSIRKWMIAGLVGNIAGFIVMILSPGNFSRADSAEEAHTGLLAMAARFLKITLIIKENYLIHVLVFVVIVIAIAYRTGEKRKFFEASYSALLFGAAFLVTCYALIAVPESQLRTYYCASLFLMVGIINGLAWMMNEGFKEELMQIFATGLVTVLSIIFLFTYIEQGANLSRIKREFDERDVYLTRKATEGEMVVEAPMLRPEWKNRFSMAYDSDITDDKFFWINFFYAEHYKLWYIIGVDRETWTEY
jgi:hypothetical protein